jgi:hydrogenase maturation protease
VPLQETTRSADTLVLALGNPLRGDDGVGEAVLAALAQAALPPNTTLLDGGTPGLETALLLQGYARAIIIDAAEMGRAPGEWVRFTPQTAHIQGADLRSTLHSAGLAEALALGEALDLLPPEIVIYGVQPETIGWQPGLSAPVEAAVPPVCAAVLKELRCD